MRCQVCNSDIDVKIRGEEGICYSCYLWIVGIMSHNIELENTGRLLTFAKRKLIKNRKLKEKIYE